MSKAMSPKSKDYTHIADIFLTKVSSEAILWRSINSLRTFCDIAINHIDDIYI